LPHHFLATIIPRIDRDNTQKQLIFCKKPYFVMVDAPQECARPRSVRAVVHGRRNGKPRKSGAFLAGYPARRHHRAASFVEWHHTTPDLRQLQLAVATLAGDIRTVARNFTRCVSGTGHTVLRISDYSSTPVNSRRQRYFCNLFYVITGLFGERPKIRRLSA
jgi:hypothetical protein